MEEAPHGASSFEVIPFPWRAASLAEAMGVARRIEPVVRLYANGKGTRGSDVPM